VARIERQVQAAPQDMRPVFLTDQPDTSIFRHAGFSYEYLPAPSSGIAAQARRFSPAGSRRSGASGTRCC
jgi:hypothetical protein